MTASTPWVTLRAEHQQVFDAVDENAFSTFGRALLDTPRRWLFSGQGRSGLVAQMAAMRFMHLGLDARMVGEPTAPPIREGDGLVVVSSSGTTPVSLSYARIARAQGAVVAVVTARPKSPLAALADVVLPVPSPATEQFAGSLFEQASLILLDSLILGAVDRNDEVLEAMQGRHTNLQ
ncbi:SIS domain-containing protein [Rathayibacter sp. ZW T2_19]|uniref:SIS domain-containing protein n=1 Tax=Rathayibacter rubneri TaxID=2950106 RepID=A0A9X2DUC7_9MICO|nr:SIS domain-containing protein [Rathayibacter rubneri]MCM6761240.1 SIS domain-containing protein [Rathayibacter rubneri]